MSDDRTRRVSAVCDASFEAAKKTMDDLLETEEIPDEEATGIFGTGLLWPAINYLVSIGCAKAEVLRVVSNMIDDMKETDDAKAKSLN